MAGINNKIGSISSKVHYPYEGIFGKASPGPTYIIKEVTGNGYINLTNAVENGLLSLKAYGGTEQRNDISCAQGPAPVGYHVPLNTEWQAVYNIWTALGGGSSDGANFGIALKLPFAGYRNRSSAGVNGQGTYARYWSSTAYSADSAYSLYFYSAGLSPQKGNNRSYGFSVRCFKNSPTVPTSSWTKLYGTSIEAGGIFWSSTDGLISLSSDGQTWVTIADKNLGATTVWNSEDTLSEANCGKYYQRGNNYGFDWTGTVTTSSTQVDASAYGPGNYYSSSTFITRSDSPYRWDTTDNRNLWGGVSISATDPTPTAPMDIVSNNGVLKFSKNMANVNSQTALVGYYISAQGQILESPYNRIYQEFIPCKPNTKYTISMSDAIYYISISEYSTAEDSGFVCRSAGSTGGNTQLTITTRSNTNYLRFGANLISADITIDDVLAINWQLEQGDTPTPYHEYVEGGVYVDGTTEMIGFGGTYSTADGQGTFVSPSSSTTTRIYKAFGKLVAGTYMVEIDGAFEFIFQYKDTLDTTPIQYGNLGTRTKSGEYEITDTTMYYGVAIRNDSQTGNITPTDFVNGNGKISIKEASGNVIAEILLKVGDYVDEQEILSGAVTRKVGIKVLDGTETWVRQDASSSVPFATFNLALGTTAAGGLSNVPLCSHFRSATNTGRPNIPDNGVGVTQNSTYTSMWFRCDAITTENAFTAWLTDQYNAGTPVIVLYPLAIPTTETVAGQTMNTPAGDSTIEITQASIDNLGLYAKYKATA